jgi:tetratricopeptide (TPR) repeat protein
VLAEKKKNLGNEQFKLGKFPAALALYEEAISYDPSNAVFYTNRALVLQKMDKWVDALADAEFAVSLDCEMLKGHVILIKCQVCS